MHKAELIKYLSKKHRRPHHHYQKALEEILAGIQDQLKQGKEVRLMGFGTFYTRMHKGGKGINFQTKQPITYDAMRLVAFRVGSLLRHAVRGKQPAKKPAKARKSRRG